MSDGPVDTSFMRNTEYMNWCEAEVKRLKAGLESIVNMHHTSQPGTLTATPLVAIAMATLAGHGPSPEGGGEC